jgi:hypothetical protein
VPRIYDELSLDRDGEAGDDGGNTIRVFLDVADSCEDCSSFCLDELLLEIKGLQFVQGNDRV